MLTIALNFIKHYFQQLTHSLWSFLKQPSGLYLFPFTQKLQVFLVLTLSGATVYLNTLGHQLAYDDVLVIKENKFVLRGIKGIPDILTHDAFHSFYEKEYVNNVLPAGRYRPLSIISFAIEQQFVGVINESVPPEYIWDINGNKRVDPDEDTTNDRILNEDDFYFRGVGLRHFVNIFLYSISIGLIYLLFSTYIKGFSADTVFVACLLFALHPIHTEVVANIKSRDEILSLFFIILSLLFAFRYMTNYKKIDLLSFLMVYTFALFSKEYAILLIFIIPASLHLFFKIPINWKEQHVVMSCITTVLSILATYLLHSTLWMVLVIGLNLVIMTRLFKLTGFPSLIWACGFGLTIYLALRWHAISEITNNILVINDIITNPYALASAEQAIATKLFILIKYVYLLLVPHPLISDYSFNTITYKTFSSWQVWLSIGFYTSILLTTIWLFIKKHALSFPLLFFIIFLLPVSNFFISIGATMGERLVYHSSLGFCFILAWPIGYISKINTLNGYKKHITLVLIFGLCIGAYFLSFNRNRAWKNNQTLFTADLRYAPDNIILLAGQANNYKQKAIDEYDPIKRKQYIDKSIQYIDKGLQIYGQYMLLYKILASDYWLLQEYDHSASACRAGLKINPNNKGLTIILESISKMYVSEGLKKYQLHQKDSAILYFDKALKANSKNTDALYNKAVILKQKGDTLNALQLLNKAIKIEQKKEFVNLLRELIKKSS